MNKTRFPELEQFLGCYFHQDWVDDYPTAEAAIEAYLTESSEDNVRAVCEELNQALNSQDSPAFLLEMGCYYNPRAEGISEAQWLKKIHKELTAHLQVKCKAH